MHLTVTQKQRGPSALLTYSLTGEVKEAPKLLSEHESEECIIDNLVTVAAKVTYCAEKRYSIFITHMKLDVDENVKIILRVTCENPSFSKKWICTEEWSDWQSLEEIGVTDDCIINGNSFMYNLQINIYVRKIEKPKLCETMYLDADFTDFTLSAANGSVAVHKIIMASHSDVFRAMLNGEWKETIEGRIEVKGTTRECLESLKDYMYLDIVPEEGLCPLLLLASRYMMENLKTRCIGKLTDTVTAEIFYELLDFACLNNIPELAYEISHSTPSEIVDKAYKSKKANKAGILPESTGTTTDN